MTADLRRLWHSITVLIEGIWLYGYLAGIAPDPAQPGFEHIVMRPMPLGDLTWVDASYASIRGDIMSSWKIEDGAFLWHVAVPPNTTATLYLPTRDADGVTESGRQAAEAAGLRFVGIRDGRCAYEAGSGTYALRCTMNETRVPQSSSAIANCAGARDTAECGTEKTRTMHQ